MEFDSESNNTEQKRKKESVPCVMVPAFEFGDPRIIEILQLHPLGHTIYSVVRCLTRVEATLKLPFNTLITTVAWTLHIDRNDAETVITKCIDLKLLSCADGFVFSQAVTDDVTRLDEKRRLLSEAGKRGANRKKKQDKGGFSHPSTSQVRKGKERLGKEISKSRTNDRSEIDPKFEKFLNEHAPATLQAPEVRSALVDWVTYRRERKNPTTPSMLKAIFREYADRGADLVRDVHHSRKNGYIGLFAPKGDQPPTPNGKPQKGGGIALLKRLAEEEQHGDEVGA